MKARQFVGTMLLTVTTSIIVAIVVESLRRSGKLPEPSPVLPQPVAPGQNTV